MQYILTEEEYKALRAEAGKAKKFDGHTVVGLSTSQLQKLCTTIANEMPVTWGWGGPDPKPWQCILDNPHDEWYCDKCPVQKICPHPSKQWSQ